MIILDGSDFVTMRKQMRTRKFNGYRNANGQEQESFQQNPGGFWRKFKPKRNRGHIGDDLTDFWHSEDEMVRVVKKIAQCSENIVQISLHSEGLNVFFGKNTQIDTRVYASRNASASEKIKSI